MTKSKWMSSKEARARLGVSHDQFRSIVKSGAVALRLYPGCQRELSRADVERIAEAAIRPVAIAARA